jgi:hypothetical protein
MARYDLNDLTARAMLALGLYGSPRRAVSSKKYTIDSSTAVAVAFPTWMDDRTGESRLPSFVKFNIPVGITALYAAWNNVVAVAPTTSVEGAELIDDQTIVGIWAQAGVSLIAEGSGDVTITYIWT